ncbi:hypothetical protein HOC37_01045 [bacterium]|nr:hypothetical protein [bacterium]MBT5989093.1 hypothetical protein [bacterium]
MFKEYFLKIKSMQPYVQAFLEKLKPQSCYLTPSFFIYQQKKYSIGIFELLNHKSQQDKIFKRHKQSKINFYLDHRLCSKQQITIAGFFKFKIYHIPENLKQSLAILCTRYNLILQNYYIAYAKRLFLRESLSNYLFFLGKTFFVFTFIIALLLFSELYQSQKVMAQNFDQQNNVLQKINQSYTSFTLQQEQQIKAHNQPILKALDQVADLPFLIESMEISEQCITINAFLHEKSQPEISNQLQQLGSKEKRLTYHIQKINQTMLYVQFVYRDYMTLAD